MSILFFHAECELRSRCHKGLDFPGDRAGAAIAAIILVLLVRSQMKQTDEQLKMTQDQVKMTKQQMDSTMRPWVGPSSKGLQVVEKGVFIFNYHNYGQVPAEDILFEFALSDIRVERQELLDKPVETSKRTILLPNETKHRKNTFDFQKRQPIGPSLFIGVLIRYKYANSRKGLYGARIEYKLDTGGVDYFDEWAE